MPTQCETLAESKQKYGWKRKENGYQTSTFGITKFGQR